MKHVVPKLEAMDEIFYQIGFTLWQLQELERNLAYYYALTNNFILEENLTPPKKTLGQSIYFLNEKNHITTEFKVRFEKISEERNWLVHHSKSENRNIFDSQLVHQNFLTRLDLIKAESLSLLKIVASYIETYLSQQSFVAVDIDKLTEKTLKEWHSI